MNDPVKSVIFWLAVVVAAMAIYAYSSAPGAPSGTGQTAAAPVGQLPAADSVGRAEGSAVDPLSGTWVLNRAKSHYGGGADPRQEETMVCRAEGDLVDCKISSTRMDGRKLNGVFRARYDGTPSTVSGMPDIDQVTITKRDDSIADATFLYRSRPVFGYHLVQSADRRSLTMISVDPETRVVLSSVVVYDRR